MSNKAMVRGVGLFEKLTPNYKSILNPGIVKVINIARDLTVVHDVIRGKQSLSNVVSGKIFGAVLGKTVKRSIKNMLIDAGSGSVSIFNRNGLGGYSWFKKLDKNERKIEKLIIVYHNAHRAGPHIDLHFGPISMIRRIPSNVDSKLKSGQPDEVLKDVRSWLSFGKILPRNVDHSPANARMQWFGGGSGINGYGAGDERKIILDTPAELVAVNDNGTTIIYVPALSNNRCLFLHKMDRFVSIGKMKVEPKDLIGKLRLKSFKSLTDFMRRVDPSSITLKEDAAAAHIVTTPKGSTVWSPRISKITGERIEYTGKVPEIARIVGDFVGMGELKFKKPDGNYLSAHETGGVLNSHSVRPRHLKPELWLYRADKVSGKDVSGLNFYDNRALQLARTGDFVKTVKLVSASDKINGEGLVGVPKGESVMNGAKFIFNGDTHDWSVIGNDLGLGPTGRTAGVLKFQSESGKKFNLGPGQLGSETFVRSLIGQCMNGMVAKIRSKKGYEGRSAKFEGWHMDK